MLPYILLAGILTFGALLVSIIRVLRDPEASISITKVRLVLNSLTLPVVIYRVLFIFTVPVQGLLFAPYDDIGYIHIVLFDH